MNDGPNDTANDFVREKTRRIVGHAALKRASRMVENWQVEEQEKRWLAKCIVVGLLIALVFAVLLGTALKLHL